MKPNNYKLCLATTFSLCCLLAPETVTAKEIFLHSENLVDTYQKNCKNDVTQITQNSDNVDSNYKENFTLKTAYLGKKTNHRHHNVESTVSENVELKFTVSQQKTGLAAKSGKKPPRKG
jgi:hypothetical protein